MNILMDQFENSVQHRQKSLNHDFVEELFRGGSTGVKNHKINNQKTLESKAVKAIEAQLNARTIENERLKKCLVTANNKIVKLHSQHKFFNDLQVALKNSYAKEFLDFAIFQKNSNESDERNDTPNSENDDLFQRYEKLFKTHFTKEFTDVNIKHEFETFHLDLKETTSECKRLKERLNVAHENISTLNSNLETTAESLHAEKLLRKQAENERDNFEYLSEKLCYLLFKYQQRISQIEETSKVNNATLFVNSTTKKERNQIDVESSIQYDRTTTKKERNQIDVESSIQYDLECPDPLTLSSTDSHNDISAKNIDQKQFLFMDRTALPAGSSSNSESKLRYLLTNAFPSPSSIKLAPLPCLKSENSDIKINDLVQESIDLTPSGHTSANFSRSASPSSIISVSSEPDELDFFNSIQDTCDSSWYDFESVNGQNIPSSKDEHQGPTSLLDELLNSTVNPDSDPTCFICEICGKSYVRKYHLNQHMKVHMITKQTNKSPTILENRRFGCDICGKSYAKKQCLVQHMPIHMRPKSRSYRCKKCGLSFLARKNGRKLAKCPNCNARCKALRNGDGSMLISNFEEPEKPFHCSYCDMSFASACNRRTHELIVHLGDARFHCAHCDKRCSRKRELVSHLQSKHFPGFQALFRCTVCDKSFTQKSRLNRHKFTHWLKSDRSFKCSECEISFKYPYSKRYHEWQVHGVGERFRCEICGNIYRTELNLTSHMQKCHVN